MKLKTMAIGTGVLLVVAVGGLLINRHANAPLSQGSEGKPLLEGIDMAKAASIEINSNDGRVTIEENQGTWTVKEQGGFPASEDKIRKFLLKLSSERIEHQVTENPEKLAELRLLTLEESGNKFDKQKTAITFFINDAEGQPMYGLMIGGDRRTKRGMSAGYGGQYVRFPDTHAAYLIAEPLFIDTMSKDWLRLRIFAFEHNKLVSRFRVRQPGQKPLVFAREDAEKEWKIQGGGKAKLDMEDVNILARRIGDLELNHIAKAGKSVKELGMARTATVDFELFDKRAYRMDIGTKNAEVGDDEFRYVTVSAKLAAEAGDEALQKEVAEFNRTFSGRVVAIYDWEAEQLLKKIADLQVKKDN